MSRIVAAEYLLVLGGGKRFFRDDNSKTSLTLKRSETAATGVTMLVCEPALARMTSG